MVDDILRSGVMLPLSVLVNRLVVDAESLRDSGDQVLGSQNNVSAHLRGESPGLGVGDLRILRPGEDSSHLRRSDVVLLHELPPHLPPVAGS
ncbi:MAG: hypothetical protein R3C68_17665 [Myxococcota bacterium]